MRRCVWGYIVIVLLLQTLCLAQVECLAAQGGVPAYAGQSGQRTVVRHDMSAGLFQDMARYIKASQAHIVFHRTAGRSYGGWFGVLQVRGVQPMNNLPPLQEMLVAPVRQTDAHLREASLYMHSYLVPRLMAACRMTDKTGPPCYGHRKSRLRV